MKLAEVHPALREWLATHEAYRKLGFHPDDILMGYVAISGQVMCVLEAQGKEFTVCCGVITAGMNEADFATLAEAARVALMTAPQEEADELWQESWIAAHAEGLVWGLVVEKGFRIPRSMQ